MATQSPISFRPDDMQRALIAILVEQGMSTSEVIKRGLELLSRSHAQQTPPIHPRSVDEPEIDELVEAAVKSACEILDPLFAHAGSAERRGISSNFQGLLADHVRAMLTGREHAQRSHSTPLNPLLARWDSFGRAYPKGDRQGIAVMRPAIQFGQQEAFFNEGRFVSLDKLDAGELYTSMEYAVADYLAYLRKREESPQEHPACLVVIDFSGPELVLVSS